MYLLCVSAANLLPSLWQRAQSNGPDSTKDRDHDSSDEKDRRGAGKTPGMGGAGEGNTPPAGRGRGAFSQFLRTHEVSMLYRSDSRRLLSTSGRFCRQQRIDWRYVLVLYVPGS